jgi:hypothetical protein
MRQDADVRAGRPWQADDQPRATRAGALVRASPLVIDLPPLRPALLGAGRLLAESVLVPTALFALVLHTNGLRPAFAAALSWCYFSVLLRWITGRRMPGTLMLCVGMFTGRACAALWMSSALVFLLQPVFGSLVMAALFVGSAVLGRPVTVRLARDFVALPAHVLGRWRVRRMFRDVAILWGLSRVADAALNVGFLHRSINAGLLARGVFSPLLTVLTIAVCAYWGCRALRSEGIRLRRASPTPPQHPAAAAAGPPADG